MLQLLSRLFGRAPMPLADSSTSGPAVDWAPIIWAYAQSLWTGGWSLKNSERADKECGVFGRGLAYGQVRVTEARERGVKFALLGEQKITPKQAAEALRKAVWELGLGHQLDVQPGMFDGDVVAIILDPKADGAPKGQWCSGFQKGESFSHCEFAQIRCWGSEGVRELEALSPEALRVLLRTAEILGFPAGPKHYANESPVRIEDIVVYAVRWEDPQTGCRYLDVLWRPELVVAGYTQGGGSHDERTEGAYKGEVLGCTPGGDWWPKKVINNRPVYAAVSKTPTPPMLKAREKFRANEAGWKQCGVEGCGKSAAWDVHVARFVMDDGFGESSHGSIYRSCDDPGHLETQKTSHGGVKVDVYPTHHEKW